MVERRPFSDCLRYTAVVLSSVRSIRLWSASAQKLLGDRALVDQSHHPSAYAEHGYLPDPRGAHPLEDRAKVVLRAYADGSPHEIRRVHDQLELGLRLQERDVVAV